MVARTRRKRASRPKKRGKKQQSRAGELFFRYLPAWVFLAVVAALVLPRVLIIGGGAALNAVGSLPGLISAWFSPEPAIAPLFTSQVSYWENDIRRWSADYDLDPDLMATVMQIESCGHPTVSSNAGAQGLFQVMPYHFVDGEDPLDPNTNVKRSAGVLQECLGYADGDVGLALACYNGGPSVITTPYAFWNSQVQHYYTWGTGIYADANEQSLSSETLDQWLIAGGSRLCNSASVALGID